MGAETAIQWTDATWTPVRARRLTTGRVGWHCEHVSPGCAFCYSERRNKWIGTGLPFKPGHRKDIEILLDEDMLLAPLGWAKPRMIFVCSMTDLFADFVTDEWIDRLWAIMALCPQHKFQVLTKRPERMRAYVLDASAMLGRQHEIRAAVENLTPCPPDKFGRHIKTTKAIARVSGARSSGTWQPLPNVWLGTSCEDQERYDERKDALRDTPAAIRFFSFEPLLGPIIAGWLGDWVIVGGESGSSARPMHPDWARSLRDQCVAADVPFFFKQHGEYVSVSEVEGPGEHFHFPDGATVRKTGKHRAGRTLDGLEWSEFPEVRR